MSLLFQSALFSRLLTVAILLCAAAPAVCAPPPISMPAPVDGAPPAAAGVLGFLDGINRSTNLLGDLWGLRTFLSRHGASLAIQQTSEDLGNVTGGSRTGSAYDGLTQVALQVDTRRAFGHYGGLFNLSALSIHGRNLSADHLATLQTASGIEADDATRLWEAWYDQKFLDEDRLDIRIGQQSLDQEFMVSNNALYFVNTMFGWPMVPSADLPGGGPAYPLSALGARLSARPVDGVQVLAGLFNGSPVRHDHGGDPQAQDSRGTSFPIGEGALAITEIQFSYPSLGTLVEPGTAEPLGWTWRLGGWYDSRSTPDLRRDSSGLSLANPLSSQQPRQHAGDWSLYLVGDQLVWRDARDPNRVIALFARVMGAPQRDRNLIDLSLNAGLTFRSPFRYRTYDTFGFGFGYAHVSHEAAALDLDSAIYSEVAVPVRSSEKFIELTYQYQWKPWVQIQPDLQYVFNPGAGVADPAAPGDPTARIRDELVLGIRTNLVF